MGLTVHRVMERTGGGLGAVLSIAPRIASWILGIVTRIVANTGSAPRRTSGANLTQEVRNRTQPRAIVIVTIQTPPDISQVGFGQESAGRDAHPAMGHFPVFVSRQ